MDEHLTGHEPGPDDVASSSPATRRPRPVRAIFAVLGTIFLAIAAVGIVVPILPTTPFVLLAAACYLRASAALHGRLLRSRTFGPTVAAWHEQRAIPPRAKAMAIVMVTATFAVSIVFVVEQLVLQLGLAAFAATLVVWLARRPSWSPPSVGGATHPDQRAAARPGPDAGPAAGPSGASALPAAGRPFHDGRRNSPR